MDRLTCNVNNHISLAYSDEDDLGWEETAKKLMYRLAKYEDEAEQREKGCNMCTRITPDTPDMPDICRMDTLHILWSDYAGEIHDLSDEPATYCPFCGRKLVE